MFAFLQACGSWILFGIAMLVMRRMHSGRGHQHGAGSACGMGHGHGDGHHDDCQRGAAYR